MQVRSARSESGSSMADGRRSCMASGGRHAIKRPATTAARGSGSLADSWVPGCGWASRPQQSSIAWTNGFERPVSRDSHPADSPGVEFQSGQVNFAGSCQAVGRVWLPECPHLGILLFTGPEVAFGSSCTSTAYTRSIAASSTSRSFGHSLPPLRRRIHESRCSVIHPPSFWSELAVAAPSRLVNANGACMCALLADVRR